MDIGEVEGKIAVKVVMINAEETSDVEILGATCVFVRLKLFSGFQQWQMK